MKQTIYFALTVKCIAQGNNGSLPLGLNLRRTGIHRL